MGPFTESCLQFYKGSCIASGSSWRQFQHFPAQSQPSCCRYGKAGGPPRATSSRVPHSTHCRHVEDRISHHTCNQVTPATWTWPWGLHLPTYKLVATLAFERCTCPSALGFTCYQHPYISKQRHVPPATINKICSLWIKPSPVLTCFQKEPVHWLLVGCMQRGPWQARPQPPQGAASLAFSVRHITVSATAARQISFRVSLTSLIASLSLGKPCWWRPLHGIPPHRRLHRLAACDGR